MEIKSRTVVVFLVFVITASTFSVFAFLYRDAMNQIVRGYRDKISNCSTITSEQECYQRAYCEGIYQPVCENCNQLEFVQCRRTSDKFVIKNAQMAELCTATGGQWHKGKYGSSCLCQSVGANVVFDGNSGCIQRADSNY